MAVSGLLWIKDVTVSRARPVVQAWHVIFYISGFFDSLFLADSGGEEQDDWLLD